MRSDQRRAWLTHVWKSWLCKIVWRPTSNNFFKVSQLAKACKVIVNFMKIKRNNHLGFDGGGFGFVPVVSYAPLPMFMMTVSRTIMEEKGIIWSQSGQSRRDTSKISTFGHSTIAWSISLTYDRRDLGYGKETFRCTRRAMDQRIGRCNFECRTKFKS